MIKPKDFIVQPNGTVRVRVSDVAQIELEAGDFWKLYFSEPVDVYCGLPEPKRFGLWEATADDTPRHGPKAVSLVDRFSQEISREVGRQVIRNMGDVPAACPIDGSTCRESCDGHKSPQPEGCMPPDSKFNVFRDGRCHVVGNDGSVDGRPPSVVPSKPLHKLTDAERTAWCKKFRDKLSHWADEVVRFYQGKPRHHADFIPGTRPNMPSGGVWIALHDSSWKVLRCTLGVWELWERHSVTGCWRAILAGDVSPAQLWHHFADHDEAMDVAMWLNEAEPIKSPETAVPTTPGIYLAAVQDVSLGGPVTHWNVLELSLSRWWWRHTGDKAPEQSDPGPGEQRFDRWEGGITEALAEAERRNQRLKTMKEPSLMPGFYLAHANLSHPSHLNVVEVNGYLVNWWVRNGDGVEIDKSRWGLSHETVELFLDYMKIVSGPFEGAETTACREKYAGMLLDFAGTVARDEVPSLPGEYIARIRGGRQWMTLRLESDGVTWTEWHGPGGFVTTNYGYWDFIIQPGLPAAIEAAKARNQQQHPDLNPLAPHAMVQRSN